MNTTLITGSSSGIGAAFARKLATRGRNVLLVARSEDKLITLCNELGRISGVRAQYFVLDLTEPDAGARLFEETRKRQLEIDMLINNAGFGSMGDFARLDLGERVENNRSQYQKPGGVNSSFPSTNARTQGGHDH